MELMFSESHSSCVSEGTSSAAFRLTGKGGAPVQVCTTSGETSFRQLVQQLNQQALVQVHVTLTT